MNAFASIGAKVEIARSPEHLGAAGGIVLPGVGAFADGMIRLRTNGWIEALEREVVHEQKPCLGLCLGMQLMASRGTEHGDAEGLGWIPGEVVRLGGDRSLKIPHVGWNDVKIVGESRLFKEMGEGGIFYFLHSYHLRLHDEKALVATCTYGDEFAAAVESNNLFGAQFHPEKSQKAGLKLLRNFVAEVGAWV